MSIEYRIGNLFELFPSTLSPVIIPHIVNSIGAWGSGFVVPLEQKWPITAQLYRRWYREGWDYERNIPFELGEAQVICVEQATDTHGPIFVVNMIGQEGLISRENPRPIKYGPLGRAMHTVEQLCLKLWDENNPVEIHAPAFGSMRAGGDWKLIENLIQELWKRGEYIKTCIYTLNEQEQKALLDSLK